MSTPLKFIVLTCSDIRSATVVNYIIQTTGAWIRKIYLDSGPGSTLPKDGARAKTRISVIGRGEKMRYHLGLAARMPRHYALQILERLMGIDEPRFLYCCERVHPALLRLACGFRLPDSLKVRPVLRSLRDIGREFGIPIVKTSNLNSGDTIGALEADQPDVLIGLGTRILSNAVLKVPRIGTLNAHSSLLPEYRGGTTEFWQLVHGETQTGVTIHWMAPRVDQGEICAQARWPISPGTNHHQLRLISLFNRLELWRDVIARLMSGEVPRVVQGSPRTPTFRHPSLRQQYEFYWLRGPRSSP